MLLPFSLIILWEWSGVFQSLHDAQYYNILNSEASMSIQLLSIKPDLKRFAKMYNTTLLTVKTMYMVIFFFSMYFIFLKIFY